MSTKEAKVDPPERLDAGAGDDDRRLVAALRCGDEAAFVALLDRYHAAMLRVAARYVPNEETAEEVVQETWLGVLRGIDRFGGRSSFKTWLFRILTNQAKRRGGREGRSVPFSALARVEATEAEPTVDPERFHPPGHGETGHWSTRVREWRQTPEEALLSDETRDLVRRAIADLPPGQRAVITVRDVEGHTAEEACRLLGLSETNQRVLLHRARAKVRGTLERYLEGT